jgi:hypothetical protein
MQTLQEKGEETNQRTTQLSPSTSRFTHLLDVILWFSAVLYPESNREQVFRILAKAFIMSLMGGT